MKKKKKLNYQIELCNQVLLLLLIEPLVCAISNFWVGLGIIINYFIIFNLLEGRVQIGFQGQSTMTI